MLVADPVAPLAGAVFDHTRSPGLIDAWTGVLAYTLQIYFDFAGYSNMAIGLGLVFGFILPRNFNLPYRSLSITEFWRRSHITLSSWFRDCLYVPLGGNRGSAAMTYRNLVVVFLLCGLWHGASWTFVLWGAWHGGFLVLERAGLSTRLSRAPSILAWTYAMGAVMFGWVLFRAPNLAVALDIWRGMVGLNGAEPTGSALAGAAAPLALGVLAIGAALALFGFGRRSSHRTRTAEVDDASGLETLAPEGSARARGGFRVAVDTAGVALLLALSVLNVSGGTYSPSFISVSDRTR